MSKALALFAFSAAVAIAGQVATRPATCRLVAYDTHGQAFIAGAGDTPAEALQGAVYPADMAQVEMICRKGRAK